MKSRSLWISTFLMVLNMLPSACGSQATSTAAPNIVEPTAAVGEPVEIPAEHVEATPAEVTATALDAAFSEFLAGMVAYNTISLDALNTMIIEESPFLLDVRQQSEVEENGHIKGSVLIPLRELGENTNLLPSFDTPIVTYCASGRLCTTAMTALGVMGWSDIKALKGDSFEGWVEAGYAVEPGLPPEAEISPVFPCCKEGVPASAFWNTAQPDYLLLKAMDEMLGNIPDGWGTITPDTFNTELVENSDLIVIDVRTEDEVETNGVIEAANYVNIPLEYFIDMKELWPEDTDANIVLTCEGDHRSTIAATILWTYGYTGVEYLAGGLRGWTEAGYPVVEVY